MNVFDTISDILTNPDKYEKRERKRKQFEANLQNAMQQCHHFAVFDKNGKFSFFEDDLVSLFLHNEYASLNKEELENDEMIVYGIKIISNAAYIPEIKFIGTVNKEGKFIKF